MKPEITILMAAYNAEEYLSEAIVSILYQTFNNFEFLIIDDHSLDNSIEIINKYKDNRIVLIRSKKNIGLTVSLNKGLSIAKGKYIARMDADDISVNKRIETQYNFMEKNPDIGICGSWVKTFDDGNPRLWVYPTTVDMVRATSIFMPVFAHSSIMIRTCMLDKNEIRYNQKFKMAQDYDFAVRCIQKFKIVNLNKVLLYYRVHPNQIGKNGFSEQTQYADDVRRNQLDLLFDDYTKEELWLHNNISNLNIDNSFLEIKKVCSWFKKIRKQNSKTKIYKNISLIKAQAQLWYRYCWNKMTYKMIFKPECIFSLLTYIGIIMIIKQKFLQLRARN